MQKTACASMIIIIIAKKRVDFLTNESESEANERKFDEKNREEKLKTCKKIKKNAF